MVTIKKIGMMQIVFLLGNLLLPNFLAADACGSVSVFEMQRDLENKIGSIVKGYDDEAIVIVRINCVKTSVSLPLTPFTVENIILPGPENETLISDVEILIFVKDVSPPAAIEEFIKKVTARVSKKVNVKFEALPSGFDKKDKNAANEAQFSWLEKISKLFAQYRKNLGYLVALLFLGALIFLVVNILKTWLAWRVATKQAKLLDSGIQRIANALEHESPRTHSPSYNTAKPFTPNTGSEKELFNSLNDKGLIALFSDCYWCAKDNYAAFIWRRLPLERKTNLLNALVFARDYVNFIFPLEEENLEHEQEPYYLTALPIEHLSNQNLLKVLEKCPEIFGHLPSMRLSAFNLPAKQQIAMHSLCEKIDKSKITLPKFKELPASALRVLKGKHQFFIANVEQEQELLAMEDLSSDIFSKLPSLIFISRLSEQQLAEFLGRFSAREIAMALIGPEEILAKIIQTLPEKKQQLVASYMKTITPSRASPAFIEIVRQGTALLENLEKESGSVNDDSKFKAA